MRKLIINDTEVFVEKNGYITTYHKQTGKKIRSNGGCLSGKYYKIGRGYHQRSIGRKLVPYHRVIAQAFLPDYSEDLQVDHINGITTDNRLENLRMVTPGMNQRLKRVKRYNSTSKFRGVCFHKHKKKWEAEVRKLDGNRVYLGAFDSEEEAAKAFNKAIIQYDLPKEALNKFDD